MPPSLEMSLLYCQCSTNKCLPSFETQSTTYSMPFRYSCTSICLFSIPKMFLAPINLFRATLTSSSLLQNVTPSVPAESIGFIIMGYFRLLEMYSIASSKLPTNFCLIPLSPSDFIFSCIKNLFRLFSVRLKSLDYYKSRWLQTLS